MVSYKFASQYARNVCVHKNSYSRRVVRLQISIQIHIYIELCEIRNTRSNACGAYLPFLRRDANCCARYINDDAKLLFHHPRPFTLKLRYWLQYKVICTQKYLKYFYPAAHIFQLNNRAAKKEENLNNKIVVRMLYIALRCTA